MTTKEEVIGAIKAHINKDFGGNYQNAFDKYTKGSNVVNKNGIMDLLYYSNVGYALTRGMIADEILKQIDKDGDGAISWMEFNDSIKTGV